MDQLRTENRPALRPQARRLAVPFTFRTCRGNTKTAAPPGCRVSRFVSRRRPRPLRKTPRRPPNRQAQSLTCAPDMRAGVMDRPQEHIRFVQVLRAALHQGGNHGRRTDRTEARCYPCVNGNGPRLIGFHQPLAPCGDFRPEAFPNRGMAQKVRQRRAKVHPNRFRLVRVTHASLAPQPAPAKGRENLIFSGAQPGFPPCQNVEKC